MKLRNTGVAVKRLEKKVTEIGGILIPETATVVDRTREGIVIETGPGTKSQPMEVSINDVIVYKRENYPTSENCDIIDMTDILYVK